MCLARCDRIYRTGGTWKVPGSLAENCAKGCAGITQGKITDETRWCSLPKHARRQKCTAGCTSASSDENKQAACRTGCHFWRSSTNAILVQPLDREDMWVQPLQPAIHPQCCFCGNGGEGSGACFSISKCNAKGGGYKCMQIPGGCYWEKPTPLNPKGGCI